MEPLCFSVEVRSIVVSLSWSERLKICSHEVLFPELTFDLHPDCVLIGGEFIVKTLKGGEPKVLHASLHTYVEYLRQNKSSLLCRFLGSYSLSMYSQTFYFVVMRNCFDPSAFINERFDIKGRCDSFDFPVRCANRMCNMSSIYDYLGALCRRYSLPLA